MTNLLAFLARGRRVPSTAHVPLHGANHATTDDPEPRAQLSKDSKVLIGFSIYVVIAALITGNKLFDAAMTLSEDRTVLAPELAYDGTAASILTWYNLAIMLPVAIRLAMKRQQVILRAAIMVAAVALPALQMAWWLRFAADMGTALWDLKFPVVIALAAHGVVAIFLMRFPADNGEGKRLKAAIPAYDARIADAAIAHRVAQSELTAQEQRVEDLTGPYDEAAAKAKRLGDKVKKAEKAFNDPLQNPLMAAKQDLEREIAALEADRPAEAEHETARKEVAAAQTLVDRTSNVALKASYQLRLDDRTTALVALDERSQRIDADSKDLRDQLTAHLLVIEQSPEQASLNAAKAESEAAADAAAKALEPLEKARKRLDKKNQAVADAGVVLEDLKKALDADKEALKKIQKESHATWRDVVFLPVFFLVLALMMDSVFMGYVLREF